MKLVPMFVLAATCTACDSGNGPDPTAASNRPPPRVVFPAGISRTVLPSGTVRFGLGSAAGADEQFSCAIDGVPAEPCVETATGGAIAYAGLDRGWHELSVEITAANGSSTSIKHWLEITPVEVVIYGATPAGVMAAVAAARQGRSVALLAPGTKIGGMMSGGLAKTDIGPRGVEVISGLATEFFTRVRSIEISRGACAAPCADEFDLEPRVAEQVFEEMLSEAGVIVERSALLVDATTAATEVAGLTTSRGFVDGVMFVDASYEGDLMAAAGVTYTIGREASTATDPALYEEFAGVRRYRPPLSALYVDPYRIPGDPGSGTLDYVEPRPIEFPSVGDADDRVMAYTYRLCVTDDPSNRVPFERPADYDAARYEASARVAVAWTERGANLAVKMFNPAATVRSRDPAYWKYDLNGGSTFSIDMTAPDLNQAYVEAGETERERIRRAYRDYAQGLIYTWQTDPRFGELNRKVERFGLCADEFVDTGHWPTQLYVRVARRMVGEYIMNENDVMQNGRRPAIVDPVAFGSYDIDTHTYRYHVGPVDWPDGVRRDALVNEGFLIQHLPDDEPYPVSYRALVPRAADATNLLNPVTLSSTAIAHSSLRMEPTFMMLGEVTGIAAGLALERQTSVQDVAYAALRDRLRVAGLKFAR